MRLKREEKDEVKVMAEEFACKCGLDTIYDNNEPIAFSTYGISRPGLILNGYSDYFAPTRVQVLGKNEMAYLNHLTPEARQLAVDHFMVKQLPCVIVSRGQKIITEILKTAKANGIPVFRSDKITSTTINEVGNYLSELLAPSTSTHGILMDIYGTGVLFTGDSGIGKSETALELVHRGHRLVSDDVVDLKLIKDKIYGTSPIITKNLMEIRGVGIIDVSAIYGVGSVLPRKIVEMVVSLEKWQEDKMYDRVDGGVDTLDILGIKIPHYTIPVKLGRNISMITEVAVKQFRLKQTGHSTLELLAQRMEEN